MAVPDPIVIVGTARTPIGAFQGDLKDLTAPELGAVAIRTIIERAALPFDSVEEVLFGCVLTAGLGQAPARQAALGAGLSPSTGAVTIPRALQLQAIEEYKRKVAHQRPLPPLVDLAVSLWEFRLCSE